MRNSYHMNYGSVVSRLAGTEDTSGATGIKPLIKKNTC